MTSESMAGRSQELQQAFNSLDADSKGWLSTSNIATALQQAAAGKRACFAKQRVVYLLQSELGSSAQLMQHTMPV